MFESDNEEELLDYIKSVQTFESSKSIEELILNNIDYLNGTLSSTCYTLGPIKSETYGILSQLKTLNKLGFITIKSYNGMKNPIYCFNESHTNKQRSYLRGLIKKSDYIKIKNISKSCDFIVVNHQKINNDEVHSFHYTGILNDDLYIKESNGFSGSIPFRVCNCERHYIKNIEEKDGYECFTECKDIYSKLLEDYYDVSILDMEFSRPYFLFDKIVESLN